jgi:hypothetical protein
VLHGVDAGKDCERQRYVLCDNSALFRTAKEGKTKGKAVPLRYIEAHLGERRYSSYSFLTSALEVKRKREETTNNANEDSLNPVIFEFKSNILPLVDRPQFPEFLEEVTRHHPGVGKMLFLPIT